MVSYVLNQRSSVSIPEATRQRVLDAAAQLRYEPNTAARSLRVDRTHTLAGVIPDVTNPFYAIFARGLQEIAEQHDYDMILYDTDGSAENERKCVRSVVRRHIDGVAGVFFHLSAQDLVQLLEVGVAVVRLEAGPKRTGELPLDNIYVDNQAAARAAVRYLLEQGRRRIAMLTAHVGPGNLRLQGYRQALRECGLAYDPALVHHCEFTEEGGYRAMVELLNHTDRPDAVFASNDMIALGAMLAARNAGVAIPEQVALMGFDDIPTAKLVNPPLTTVAQFQRELGQRATAMLLERLGKAVTGAGRNIEMPYQIIVRKSA